MTALQIIVLLGIVLIGGLVGHWVGLRIGYWIGRVRGKRELRTMVQRLRDEFERETGRPYRHADDHAWARRWYVRETTGASRR